MGKWHGGHPGPVGRVSAVKKHKASGAVSCPTETRFFRAAASLQLLSQETPDIPSCRRRREDYTQLHLNYQGITFVRVSAQRVKYQSVLAQKLQCSIRLEPFSGLLLKFRGRNLFQDVFLLPVRKGLLQVVYTLQPEDLCPDAVSKLLNKALTVCE